MRWGLNGKLDVINSRHRNAENAYDDDFYNLTCIREVKEDFLHLLLS